MKGKIFILALLTLGAHISQAQNIGIGQTSPKAPLDINGGVTIGTGTSFSGSASSTTGALIQGPVGIGNHSPNINTILDLTNSATSQHSTTGGLLLPKVANIATETGMASPANGTVFYNTSTNCVDLYDNGKWQSIFCSCPALAAPAISGPSSPCALSTNNVYSVPVMSGATSYTWSISGATFTTTPATNATSVSVTAPANTPFTLNCTISNACGTSIVTATTTITPNYTVATITGATTSATAYQVVNYNQSVVYTLPTGGSSYTWSVVAASGGYTPTITPSTGSNTVTVSWASTTATIGTEDDVTVTGSYIPSGSTCPSVGSLAVQAGGTIGPLNGQFTLSGDLCTYYSIPYNAPISANWGATNYKVTVAGASGGVNSQGTGTPGYGEVITATITVPLTALPFYAMTGSVGLSGSASNGDGGPIGGCFAGGAGGYYYWSGTTNYSGGGGGGSTSIQTDAAIPFTSADAVIVAGGGGGAGYDVGGTVANGGNAGAVGYPGGSTTASTAANGDNGGGGGTAAGGGAGASYNGCGTDAAGAGIQGAGGTPGIGTSGSCNEYGGAGGGQGWYGGGGGGSGAGGGGSSYPTTNGTYNGITVSSLSVPTTGTNNGNGYVTILY